MTDKTTPRTTPPPTPAHALTMKVHVQMLLTDWEIFIGIKGIRPVGDLAREVD